ncbi:hypothetical protein GCM10027259_07530 [Micromonospora palomenae]
MPAPTVTSVVSECDTATKTAAHAMAMTPRVRKTYKVLVSGCGEVFMPTSEVALGDTTVALSAVRGPG